MAEIKLMGVEALLAKLNQISERVANVAENKALRQGAEVLRKKISERAPQPPGAKYAKGKLAKSIVVSKIKRLKTGVKYMEVGPSEDAFYSQFLEYGTVKMAAKPFMGPAVEESPEEVYSAMANELRKEIEKRT